MKIFILFFLLFFYTSNLFAAESLTKSLPQHEWSFEGITGTFDRGALQRGYQVYSEVCSGCHSMKLLYYRDLLDIVLKTETNSEMFEILSCIECSKNLKYAEIPYEVIYDKEVLSGLLPLFDWLHLHHEDFTVQYGKFYVSFKNATWYK